MSASTAWHVEEGPAGRAVFGIGDRQYRYVLSRKLPADLWTKPKPPVVFVMLNPSKADSRRSDPTVTRCALRATRMGAAELYVLNLFAWRATDPDDMLAQGTGAVGPLNDRAIASTAAGLTAATWIAAWGVHGSHLGRDQDVTRLLTACGVKLHRLGPPTKDGHPRHPLYVPASAELEPHT